MTVVSKPIDPNKLQAELIAAGIDASRGLTTSGGALFSSQLKTIKMFDSAYNQVDLPPAADAILTAHVAVEPPTQDVINHAIVPSGGIIMWAGLLLAVPTGWTLCDGQNGTPDLRDRFIYGWSDGVNPGPTGGSAAHAHADHVVTQPANHSNHAVTQPNAHANHAVTQPANHVVTQPSAHSNHVVTQPGAHSNHVVTQPASHVVTQPSAHSNHVVTQPAAHSDHAVTQPAAHAALAAHAHELPFIKVAGATGQLRMLASSIFGVGTSRAPESVSAAPTALTTAAAVELSQGVSGGTPSAHSGTAVDAHSAHSGAAVDAHSAHSGAAVDAHSGAAVDAHSAHSGAAVDAHSAHTGSAVDAHSGAAVDAHSAHAGAAVDAHSAHSGAAVDSHQASSNLPPYVRLAFIQKL